MFNFLHTFHPQPILFELGPIRIYWYGLFIVLGLVLAMLVILKLAKRHGLPPETVFDLFFYLVLGGFTGSRLYAVLLEFSYYRAQPLNILKVWQGGLAVHGAIIGCAIALFFFAKKRRLDLWLLAALIATVAPLAQAVGRWGNYFNQELFGKPTGLPWGIPIDIANRPAGYLSDRYFHPAFLYESVGNLLIFIILIFLYQRIVMKIKKTDTPPQVTSYKLQVISYLVLYSLLRFSLEFIKIDRTPELLGLRWPQIMSLIIIFFATGLFFYQRRKAPSALAGQ